MAEIGVLCDDGDVKMETDAHSSSLKQSDQTHSPSNVNNGSISRTRFHSQADLTSSEGGQGFTGAFQNVCRGREQIRNCRSPNKENQPLLKRVTCRVTEFYRAVNSTFRYSRQQNPRRVLSTPSERVLNEGYDNRDNDLVLCVNDVLKSDTGHQFQVIDLLGKGTFGQVVKCHNLSKKDDICAVKVIKNKPAYFNQALVEIRILKMLNEKYDPENSHNIVRLLDFFKYKKHLCLVFELLNVNLYDLVKQNSFRGLSCSLIRVFIRQVLNTLIVLRKARIIHCDLKPENILLKDLTTPKVKVIDFGSACFEFQTIYSYIQSRFYRSPEVLLGHEYNCNIDMWSLGCIAAELFLGLPLYLGKDEFNQIQRITEMQSDFPHYLMEKGTKRAKYYNTVRDPE
eukprot:761248_1